MMRLPSRQHRSAAHVLLAAAALGGALAIVPAAAAAPVLPILWEGQVHGPDQAPAGAEVVAYARPPADALKRGVPITEIARTQTGRDGRFTLRAAPAALAGVADEGGWADVMVVATGADGMALAVDSVSWKPAADGLAPFAAGAPGRWVTTPAALLATPKAFALAGYETPEALSTERPSILTLERGGASVPLAKRPGGNPPKGETHCAPSPRYRDVGVSPVAVGELHREAHWGGEFVYTSTKSSSFQIGGSATGEGWKVAGSKSMSETREGRASGYERPTDHLIFETSYADMVFTRFEWVCGEPYWYKAYTLEPTEWTGGMHDWPGVNPTTCKPGKTIPVPPEDKFERSKGSSQTLEKAINVDRFLGSVTTGFTMSTSDTSAKGVGEMWENLAAHERYLCGNQEFPTRTTRVVSLP